MTKKQWLVATIFTFLTIICWVIFDILHTQAQVEVSPKVQQIIEPINPNFNIKNLQSQ